MHSPHPQRIASLLSSATEILYALGLGDRVVAISHECDFPREALDKPRATICRLDIAAPSGEIDTQVRSRLEAGLPLYEVDRNLLARLEPDLIVTQAQCDVCAVRYQDVVETVRSLPRLRDAEIVALNPASLDDILGDILRVGEAAGCPTRAAEYVASLRCRIARVRQTTQDLPEAQRPRVACIEWIEPLMLAGNWMPELLQIAGAAPGIVASSGPSQYRGWREVLDYRPEVIIVMPCGFDAQRAAAEAATLTKLPGWRDLPAVRRGRVFAVDASSYFNRPGPRIVESLELLAHLVHPERFPQPELPGESSLGEAAISLTEGNKRAGS
jgi:iron complex transport system substrate-binding protein